ncbi:hypothetical protein [Kitasatospora sp. NPDC087315]|uniref:hypothetical protein n=1 Tax=Kitasatospora sp. NPDC087315 TaxID=3364069 RepID=UPI0037F9CADE
MRDSAGPFEYDGPVAGDQVVDRCREAEMIKAWAREGQLMALVAPRRFGKTSLIHKIAAEGQRDGLTVVTADLFGVASFSDLVLRLERAWASYAPEVVRPAVSKILAASQAGVSITGSGFASAMDSRPAADPLAALNALLELPSLLAQREGGRTLIVLDEFQSASGVPGAEALIRQHACRKRAAVSYLFSGSRPDMLSTGSAEGEPVSVLRLGRLPRAKLGKSIQQRFATTGDRDVTGVLDELLAAGEGHPQRTMLLAHLLWQEVPVGEPATSDHLDAAIAAALRQVDPEARATMSGLSVGQRKVLRAVAEYGAPMAARAVRTLGLPKTTAQKAAPHLVSAGLIEDTSRGWRVIDPLLARWIQTKYGTRA